MRPLPTADVTVLAIYVAGVVLLGAYFARHRRTPESFSFGIDQSYVQCYHAAGSVAGAKRLVWIAASLYIPISLVFFVIRCAASTWPLT